MKLYYFQGKGRAEASRLVMRLGGKEFEDIRFNREEWMAKYKPQSPAGQVCVESRSITALPASIAAPC